MKEFHAIAVNFADKITCGKIELNNYFDNRQLNFTTIKKTTWLLTFTVQFQILTKYNFYNCESKCDKD